MDTVNGMTRKYSDKFKRQVVEEAMAPGASVAAIARKRGLNANMIFTWRTRHRRGELGKAATAAKALPAPGFVAVGIVNEAGQPVPVVTPDKPKLPERTTPKAVYARRMVELELRNGLRLRVDAGISTETLRRIVSAMVAL
jgi:transposase